VPSIKLANPNNKPGVSIPVTGRHNSKGAIHNFNAQTNPMGGAATSNRIFDKTRAKSSAFHDLHIKSHENVRYLFSCYMYLILLIKMIKTGQEAAGSNKFNDLTNHKLLK
jgi:hypothetical protein